MAHRRAVDRPALMVDSPSEGVTRVTLDRPRTRNAITNAMLADLFGLFDRLRTDLSCRVLILTGAGRAFSSGHDLGDHSRPEWLSPDVGPVQGNLLQNRWWATIIPRLRALPQPVIAAINGPVAGGAMALALGADLRIAGRSASFVNAFHPLGGSGTELGLAYVLQRTVGAQRAAELLLTDRRVDADEAAAIGLVLRTVDDDVLQAEAVAMARSVAASPPLGAWSTKATLWSSLEVGSLDAAIELEARGQILALATADADERRRADAEHRPPRYTAH